MLLALLGPAGSAYSSYQPAYVAAPIARPPGKPCRIVLFANHPFAGDAPLLVSYKPSCRGPWSKIVLRLDTSIKGTQYDRLGALWLDRAELMRFTTAEPTKRGIQYTVEKDVTPYAPLMRAPGAVTVSLANYVSKKYDGIYRVSATLQFYPASHGSPAGTPDAIVPVENEASVFPWNTTATLREALPPLPRNVVRATLDVYATNHDCDEFWYSNLPDAYAAAHKNDGLCGGGTYREIDGGIDGRPAFVVYPFPYIWTGGINPLLWRPLSAIDTLNVPAYRVDLDPWAGVLSDGKSHTLTLTVMGSHGVWPMDADLLLWTDKKAAHTGGGITRDDIRAPNVSTEDGLNDRGGSLLQSAIANWTVSGFVDTSRGRIEYTTQTAMHFKNRQAIDLHGGVDDVDTQTAFTVRSTTVEGGRRKDGFVGSRYALTANSTYPPIPPKSPFSLIIYAGVKQTRIVRTAAASCAFKVAGAATLKRRKDGSDPVAEGSTTERYTCTGAHPLTISTTARDGALVSPTSQRRTQWKSNRPTSPR